MDMNRKNFIKAGALAVAGFPAVVRGQAQSNVDKGIPSC